MDILKLIGSIFAGLLKWWNNKTLKDAGKDEAELETLEKLDEMVIDIDAARHDDRLRESIRAKYARKSNTVPKP